LVDLPGIGRPGQGARRGPGGPPHIIRGADPSEFGTQVHSLLANSLPPDQATPEALELANNFHQSPLGQRAAAANLIHREQTFLISLDGRLVSGQIDLWFTDAGETILVDYKTGQTSDDTLQLNLYALAIPPPVHHAFLYFLRPNLAVEVPLDSAAARAKVEELYQAQSRLDFPLHEGPHCHHCPYFRGLCPAR